MEIQQLRYVVALARTRHFTRAAEACHVSQPTLSHQLRRLEDELGEPLFKRLRTGAVPTPFGERFLVRARRILAEVEAAEGEALSLDEELRGRLVVGAIPTIAPYLLPGWIREFARRHPQVELEIREETTDVLIRALLDGAVDLAVVSPPFDREDLTESRVVREDELLVTLPQAHPLAGRRKIGVSDLAELPLILMKEEHCLSRQSLEICEQSGHRPRVAIQSSQLDTVLALIETGFGISFTPSIAVGRLERYRVVHREVGPERAYRRISIVWPRGLSLTRAERTFVDLAASGP